MAAIRSSIKFVVNINHPTLVGTSVCDLHDTQGPPSDHTTRLTKLEVGLQECTDGCVLQMLRSLCMYHGMMDVSALQD